MLPSGLYPPKTAPPLDLASTTDGPLLSTAHRKVEWLLSGWDTNVRLMQGEGRQRSRFYSVVGKCLGASPISPSPSFMTAPYRACGRPRRSTRPWPRRTRVAAAWPRCWSERAMDESPPHPCRPRAQARPDAQAPPGRFPATSRP